MLSNEAANIIATTNPHISVGDQRKAAGYSPADSVLKSYAGVNFAINCCVLGSVQMIPIHTTNQIRDMTFPDVKFPPVKLIPMVCSSTPGCPRLSIIEDGQISKAWNIFSAPSNVGARKNTHAHITARKVRLRAKKRDHHRSIWNGLMLRQAWLIIR